LNFYSNILTSNDIPNKVMTGYKFSAHQTTTSFLNQKPKCFDCTWWRNVCWAYLMKKRVLSVPDEETCVECTWWRNVWYVFNYISTFLTTLQCTFRYQHGLISFQEPSKLKHKLINTCAFQKNCFNSSSKTDRNCFKY
jgi:hypothetical protein